MDDDRPVLALSGGVGGAKLALGLYRVLRPDTLTVVANTGDDFEHLGLSISPDLDTLLYTLSGEANPDQRHRTGLGQRLSAAIHEAVSKQTESDVPNWLYSRITQFRQTGRHARHQIEPNANAMTKDGRWILPYDSYAATDTGQFGQYGCLRWDCHGSYCKLYLFNESDLF